jgi:hypothetical protein
MPASFDNARFGSEALLRLNVRERVSVGRSVIPMILAKRSLVIAGQRLRWARFRSKRPTERELVRGVKQALLFEEVRVDD